MTPQRALIFANGDINDGPMVRQAIADAHDGALVVAADGGARLARHFGLHVDVIIGDMDSLDKTELQTFADAHIERYPEAKNETDLELALLWAHQQGVRWMRVIGGVGDRIDQTIANMYLLALPELHDSDVRLVGGRQESWLLFPGEAGYMLHGAAGDTVSLIPINGAADGVRTENLYYPLRGERLAFGPARGISNIMNADTAQVWVRDGLLLVVHTIGRA